MEEKNSISYGNIYRNNISGRFYEILQTYEDTHGLTWIAMRDLKNPTVYHKDWLGYVEAQYTFIGKARTKALELLWLK